MSEITYYSGRVERVRFSNEAQSYYVLSVMLDTAKDTEFPAPIIVRGYLIGMTIREGTWFGFEGHWETHDSYGRQVVIDRAPVLRGSWDVETTLKVLQGHGVGVRTCESLQAHFGEGLMEALSDKTRLQEIPSITEFTAEFIMSRWISVRAMYQSLQFLGDFNLPRHRVEQVYAHFGDDAEKVLSENPWALVQIDGITFEQADEVARRLGLDMGTEKRLRGAALSVCKSRRGVGHLFLTSGDVVQGIGERISEASKPDIARMLKTLHDENLLVLDNRTKPPITAIYEPWFNRLEIECAKLLSTRFQEARIVDPFLQEYMLQLASVGPQTETVMKTEGSTLRQIARSAIEEWSNFGQLKLSESQLQGAVNALVEPVTIITGLPGTGKTTLLKLVVKVFQDTNVPFLLVAPTGIAAKRITSVTGAEASTIHRAFEAKGVDTENGREATYAGIVGDTSGGSDSDGSSESWGYSNLQPHPALVVIIDESSMVDQHLLFRLLTCTARNCRLVFVGDAAQLPSVGPGNVLKDLISSKQFPVVDLHEIFRQDEASHIVVAAHAIHAGRVPVFEQRSREFVFMEVRDEQRVLETVTGTVQKLFDRRANFQVLSPRHSGILGVTNFNLCIRELLNPRTPGIREMRLGSETVREEDRVMVSKNSYQYGIFNGDVGKIVKLDLTEKIVEVKIHGTIPMHVQLPFKEASSLLRLAYAITVHKSQGQEYDIILMPWVSSFRLQLQRNLIYTAITRARKKVILIGHPEALEKAVLNNKVDDRNTLFPERLALSMVPPVSVNCEG